MEERELINEFVVESNENLARIDQEMVELEKDPGSADLIASIFRTIHTIKGTCGFLGFGNLERVTHHAENLLSQVRSGRAMTSSLTSLILEAIDVAKNELVVIEQTGHESGDPYGDLVDRLSAAREGDSQSKPLAGPPSRPGDTPDPVPVVAVASAPPAAAETPRPATASTVAATGAPALSGKVSVADQTIRVEIGLLDRLMNLVGELVLARNQVLQFTDGESASDNGLGSTAQRLNQITSQLQEGVMKTRMQPIGVVWSKLPRVVRDLAFQCGKQIRLDMEGADTELDKSIIEAIKDPLTHIVRNACDHGIERPPVRTERGKPAGGRLLLRAFHEGGQVNIEIIDDGGGIDAEKVKAKAIERGILRPDQAAAMSEREALLLVFAPGFSTAEKVTNLSGRGVGMDVVRTNIERMGGVVDLSSRVGEGTTVRIKIPLTLAIIPGLIVGACSERFVIPQVSLVELVRLEGHGRKQVEWLQGAPVFRRRGRLLPLVSLGETLGLGDGWRDSAVFNIVVLSTEDRQFGLVVDQISDTQEIVVKPLGKQIKDLAVYAGATIMGDGRVALILDVAGIAQRAGLGSEARAGREHEAAGESQGLDRQSFVLVRSAAGERMALPLAVVARLEEFEASRVERASGRPVIQYRENLLPLIDVLASADSSEKVPVIVVSDGDHQAGLMVAEILDIVEDTVEMRSGARRPGTLGSAVIGGSVADLLDVAYLLDSSGENWTAGRREISQPVLVADSSPFARGVVRATLEMAGYRVVEASSVAEALERLSKHQVRAVAADIALPGGGAAGIARQLRSHPSSLPVIALARQIGMAEPVDDVAGCLPKFDAAALVAGLETLMSAQVEEAICK